MQIQGLQRYQRRNQSGYFDDLPFHLRGPARGWLDRFVRRRRASGKQFPQWLFALYVGQAKRLAGKPPSSEWGRSMLAKRGGHAVQRKYLYERRHPTIKATRVRVARQRAEAGREQVLSESQASSPMPAPYTPFSSVTISQGRIVRNYPNLEP